jgi:hypothetical protein
MSATRSNRYLNVFTVEEYDTPEGEKARRWIRVGVAFPHAEGPGFNVELQCFPRDGKLVALAPSEEELDPDAEQAPARTGPAGVPPRHPIPAAQSPALTIPNPAFGGRKAPFFSSPANSPPTQTRPHPPHDAHIELTGQVSPIPFVHLRAMYECASGHLPVRAAKDCGAESMHPRQGDSAMGTLDYSSSSRGIA